MRQQHAPGAGVPGQERELLLRYAGRSIHDQNREEGRSEGQSLVVTRLNTIHELVS